jgi:hypothetical protein
MDAISGNFDRAIELFALIMKKVRTAAVVAAKTPEPTKSAARFLRAGVPRGLYVDRPEAACLASCDNETLVIPGSRRRFPRLLVPPAWNVDWTGSVGPK